MSAAFSSFGLGAPQGLWLLLLAPATWAGGAWLWRRRRAATTAWASRGLWNRLLPIWSDRRQQAALLLLATAVGATVLALARPRWGAGSETVEREGIDIVFVLDSSLSMAAGDVAPNRLWVAQALVRRLVEALPGNRVALVQAEGAGVAMTPLTLDAAVIDLLLDAIQPGSLPTPGTELAPALAAAIELFPPESKQHRAIVLLSDGEDHGGHLDEILGNLREQGVVVSTVGVGTPQGAPVPDLTQRGAYKKDREGKVVISRLGEEGLERMARESGGSYLRATNAGVDLDPLVGALRGIEGRALEAEAVVTGEERFQWPLALGIVALIAYLVRGAFRPDPRAAEVAT